MDLITNVRQANPNDVTALVENNLALARETENYHLNKDILRDGIEQALKREECHYFVALTDKIIVGQAMITYEWSDWRNGIIWWIQSVYVLPEYRQQGIFRSIFMHMENLARNHPQVKVLRLYVKKNNHTGQNTYQSLGMRHSGYIVYEKENLS